MCGFAGFINFGRQTLDRRERQAHLRAMGAQLARRGPDDEQFFDDDVLSFVFRRLSIIDIEGGRQPLWNEDRTIFAAVNGEIYNHREIRQRLSDRHVFRTQSDSEVIVHLYEEYGDAFVTHLNGMFAIVIWDTRRRRLLLVRDRMGIKPLFFTRTKDNSFLFASELKALLVHPLCPREFEWSGIHQNDLWAPSVPTCVQGVSALLGGHRLSLNETGETVSEAYWSLEEVLDSAKARPDPDAICQRYGELLDESVRMRLMSDVPVGIFLSGGIDSSLLASIAARDQPDLHCFTIVEDTLIEAGDVQQARRVAESLGLPLHPLRISGEGIVDELNYDLSQFEFLVWLTEKPLFRVEWFLKHELHRFAKTRVSDLKVMLLGQGADEFAGGYSRSANFEKDWGAYLDFIVDGMRINRWTEMDVPLRFRQLLADHHQVSESGYLDFFDEMRRRVYTLQRHNLWHEDRTSSAQGIESRVPFLDHRLVELLASVPAELHESLFYDKRIVRRHLSRVLPEYPPDKLKVGFTKVGSEISIYRMMLRILRRIFPAFREKYLLRRDAVFSEPRLTELVSGLLQSARISKSSVDCVFDCMAVAVFRDLCRNLIHTGVPPGVNPPSPLRAAEAHEMG